MLRPRQFCSKSKLTNNERRVFPSFKAVAIPDNVTGRAKGGLN